MSLLDLSFPDVKWLSRWGLIAVMRGTMLACRFVLVVFLSRYLDLASLGAFGLIAGTIAIMPAFAGLGLVHTIMRDAVTMAPRQLTNALRHYWSYVFALYAIILPIAMVTASVSGWSENVGIVAIVVAIALFEQIGNDTFQLLTNLERPVLATLTAFVRQAAWILVYAPLAAFYDARFRSLEVLLIFWLAGAVLSFVIFAGISRKWPWRTSFGRSFRPLWLLSRVRSSLVIYASDISFIASQYIDRYVVTLFLGLKVAGLYMLYWTAANAMYTFVSMTVLQQQRPLLIRTNLEGNLSFRRLCAPMALRTAMATVFFGLMVGVAFEIVLPLLKQPLATENLTAFWLIISGLAARCMADWGAIALFAARRDQIMTITNLAAVTGLAVCQSVLLPFAGLAGAGIALLVTFAAVTYWRMQLVFSGPVYRQARMEA